MKFHVFLWESVSHIEDFYCIIVRWHLWVSYSSNFTEKYHIHSFILVVDFLFLFFIFFWAGTMYRGLGSSHQETFWWSLRRKVEIHQKSHSRDGKPTAYVLLSQRITRLSYPNLGRKMEVKATELLIQVSTWNVLRIPSYLQSSLPALELPQEDVDHTQREIAMILILVQWLKR